LELGTKRTDRAGLAMTVDWDRPQVAGGASNRRGWPCAPRARTISEGKSHPDKLSIGPEAGRRLGQVTGWVGALRRRRPWAAERSPHPRPYLARHSFWL